MVKEKDNTKYISKIPELTNQDLSTSLKGHAPSGNEDYAFNKSITFRGFYSDDQKTNKDKESKSSKRKDNDSRGVDPRGENEDNQEPDTGKKSIANKGKDCDSQVEELGDEKKVEDKLDFFKPFIHDLLCTIGPNIYKCFYQSLRVHDQDTWDVLV